MESLGRPRKAVYVLVLGVLSWGVSVALIDWLFDWHRTGRAGPAWLIAFRFAVFTIGGAFWGLWMWKKGEKGKRRQVSRSRAIVETVLFFVVMAGLLYILWRMY